MNKNANRTTNHRGTSLDYTEMDRLLSISKPGAPTIKQIAQMCHCSNRTVELRITEKFPDRKRNKPQVRRVNCCDVAGCGKDRGSKAGFIKYMTDNPVYLAARFKGMTAEQAWEDMERRGKGRAA